jgi:DNA replication protein DnaC
MRLQKWIQEGAPVSRLKVDIAEEAMKKLTLDAQERVRLAIAHEKEVARASKEVYLQKLNATPTHEEVAKSNAEIVALASNGFALQFGKTFAQLPHYQQKAIKAMCMKHLGYEPKNADGLNAEKGLYIAGPSQIGKTAVFEYLKSIGFKYRIVTAYQLASFAHTYGEESLVAEYTKGQYLVIDEIGWEEPAKVYGQLIDVVPLLIHSRFRNRVSTHFTSNFRVDDLRYEDHIKMRIKQSCNVIETGKESPFLK